MSCLKPVGLICCFPAHLSSRHTECFEVTFSGRCLCLLSFIKQPFILSQLFLCLLRHLAVDSRLFLSRDSGLVLVLLQLSLLHRLPPVFTYSTFPGRLPGASTQGSFVGGPDMKHCLLHFFLLQSGFTKQSLKLLWSP